MQAGFIAAFLRGCKERGLHTALDTCGQSSRESLKMLLPHTDMVLYDIKAIDTDRHKKLTGHPSDKILRNLIYLRDYMKSNEIPEELWIRTPIIPDATAMDDIIEDIGRYIAINLKGVVSRWELCSFNNLCRDKYIRLGLSWQFKDFELLTETVMEHLTEVAKNSGIDPDIVHWTGSTRIEEDTPSPRLVGGQSTA